MEIEKCSGDLPRSHIQPGFEPRQTGSKARPPNRPASYTARVPSRLESSNFRAIFLKSTSFWKNKTVLLFSKKSWFHYLSSCMLSIDVSFPLSYIKVRREITEPAFSNASPAFLSSQHAWSLQQAPEEGELTVFLGHLKGDPMTHSPEGPRSWWDWGSRGCLSATSANWIIAQPSVKPHLSRSGVVVKDLVALTSYCERRSSH